MPQRTPLHPLHSCFRVNLLFVGSHLIKGAELEFDEGNTIVLCGLHSPDNLILVINGSFPTVESRIEFLSFL